MAPGAGALLMEWRGVSLLVLSVAVLCGVVSSATYPGDSIALQAIRKSLVDNSNSLSNWVGDDPCGGAWTGVYCVEADYPTHLAGSEFSHVTELRLLQLNLKGQLAPEIGNLSALKYLDVMWNEISGSIPTTVGDLQNLRFLLLSGNQFSGFLPRELGLLSGLNRLQLDENKLSGPLPNTFAYPNLPNIEHIQLNNNSLNGSIPAGLATLSTVHHLLLDNNRFNGTLPVQIASMPNLVTIQLDNNKLDATIPEQYGTMSQLIKLSLRNCDLKGAIPNFSRSGHLAVLDLSRNSLTGSVSNAALSSNLTAIDLSYNNLSGIMPLLLSSLPALQFLELRRNDISGMIPSNLGIDSSSSSIMDFQDNSITGFANRSNLVAIQSQGKSRMWLSGNPFCRSPIVQQNKPLCAPRDVSTDLEVGAVTYVPFTDPSICAACSSPYVLVPGSQSSKDCRCAVPIGVQGRLGSPSFVIFDPYVQEFSSYLATGLNLSVHQVQVQDYVYQPGPRILYSLLLFPTGANFDDGEVAAIYEGFANWKIPSSDLFGPYDLISFLPPSTSKDSGHRSHGLSTMAIAGIVVGVVAFVVLKTLCMFHSLRAWLLWKNSRPDGKGDKGPAMVSRRQSTGQRRSYSSIKVASVKEFSFDEIAKATDGFSCERLVGEGGYGKVYSGVLEDGQKVAVKRAEEGSFQGSREFETEIQLLSRVHHRNLVALVGYCNEEDEQLLVYEFIAYGSLQHNLLGPATRVPLNFVTRLQIALGSARGIHYLHTQADPPIFHRDVKASNILLDEFFQAKVSDFGLSKLAPLPDLGGAVGYVSTVVKGTPGYLDPEYFKTHRFTDKSDVFSLGVVLLVLVTGTQPITDGKNLVREVNIAVAAGELSKIVDFRIRGSYPHRAMQSLAALALVCCRDAPDERPTIGEVLARLEQLWKETYADAATDRDDAESLGGSGYSGYSGDLRQEYSRSEDSFIEIDPSVLSSVVSSTVWTSSGKHDSGSTKEPGSINILNPR